MHSQISNLTIILLLLVILGCVSTCGQNAKQEDSPSQQIAAPAIQSGLLAATDSTKRPESIRVAVQLRDGSKILGHPEQDSLTLQTQYATLNLAFTLLQSIEFTDTSGSAATFLQSGERLRGILANKSLNLQTIVGPLTIPIRDITRIDISKVRPVPDSGLVAFYPFDGNAHDKSGHGYDGTVRGAKLCDDRKGNPNSAYSFDGNDSYILIPDGIVRHDAAAFSISAWLFAPEFDGRRMAVYLGAATGEVQVQVVDRRMTLSIKLIPQWYGVSTNMLFNTWVHIVGVYRRGESCTLWINGEEKAEVPIPREDLIHLHDMHHSSIGSYSPAYFDYAHSNGIGSWSGSIDQLRIYNRALEPEEIRALFTLDD